MLCLGLETSCDDTGVALVRDGVLLDSLLASQAEAHAIFGGVVPELASREHGRILGPMLDTLLARNFLSPEQIDVIAVARGPGLLGSLLTGMAFAKGLALTLQKPLIGVNHLHAHLLVGALSASLAFPGIGLVVSGGHTELYRLESPAKIIRLGRTLDDAAGELFDKAGHSIGFPYPAGKFIDETAKKGSSGKYPLPYPYIQNDNLDFSFSGLKTAAINLAKGIDSSAALPDFCASLNHAVAETLAIKTERALAADSDICALYLAGGVAANSAVRSRLSALAADFGIRLILPPPSLCTDNGAMIAYTGWLLAEMGYRHGLELEAIPRGRAIPDDMVCD